MSVFFLYDLIGFRLQVGHGIFHPSLFPPSGHKGSETLNRKRKRYSMHRQCVTFDNKNKCVSWDRSFVKLKDSRSGRYWRQSYPDQVRWCQSLTPGWGLFRQEAVPFPLQVNGRQRNKRWLLVNGMSSWGGHRSWYLRGYWHHLPERRLAVLELACSPVFHSPRPAGQLWSLHKQVGAHIRHNARREITISTRCNLRYNLTQGSHKFS